MARDEIVNSQFKHVETQCYEYLMTVVGYHESVTCGVLANIDAESKFDPDCLGDLEGGVYKAYGLCQWRDDRRKNLESKCKEWGLSHTSVEGQLEFMKWELEGGDSKGNEFHKKAKSGGTNYPGTLNGARNAAFDFASLYERCSPEYREPRRDIANSYYEYYSGVEDPTNTASKVVLADKMVKYLESQEGKIVVDDNAYDLDGDDWHDIYGSTSLIIGAYKYIGYSEIANYGQFSTPVGKLIERMISDGLNDEYSEEKEVMTGDILYYRSLEETQSIKMEGDSPTVETKTTVSEDGEVVFLVGYVDPSDYLKSKLYYLMADGSVCVFTLEEVQNIHAYTTESSSREEPYFSSDPNIVDAVGTMKLTDTYYENKLTRYHVLSSIASGDSSGDSTMFYPGTEAVDYVALTAINPYAMDISNNLEKVRAAGFDYGYLIDMTHGGQFRFYIPEFTEIAGANWESVDLPGRSVRVKYYHSTESRSVQITVDLFAGVGLYTPYPEETLEDVVGRVHKDAYFLKSLEYPDYSVAIARPPSTVHLILGSAFNLVGVVSGVEVTHKKPYDSQNRAVYLQVTFTVTQTEVNPPDYSDIRQGRYSVDAVYPEESDETPVQTEDAEESAVANLPDNATWSWGDGDSVESDSAEGGDTSE